MTAYASRLPAGFAGELTRNEGAVAESVVLREAVKYGWPVKMTSSKAENIDASDTAANFYGVLQRAVPQIDSGNDTDTADVNYVQNVIRRGYCNVKCATGTPVKGGQVYMRVVTENSQLVGDFETAYDYSISAGAMVGSGNATAGTLSATEAATPGVYRALCTAATAFNLISPSGDLGKVGAFGAAYTAFGVTFTITAGATPAVAGDYIDITVTANTVALPGVTFASAGKDSSNVCEIQIA